MAKPQYEVTVREESDGWQVAVFGPRMDRVELTGQMLYQVVRRAMETEKEARDLVPVVACAFEAGLRVAHRRHDHLSFRCAGEVVETK